MITHTGHTTFDRTPLDKWSARRKDLYLTTHKPHKRETPMPPAGLESTIPARQRLQNHAFHCAATRIGKSSPRRANWNAITEKTTLSMPANTINCKNRRRKIGVLQIKFNRTSKHDAITTPDNSYTLYPVAIATRYGLVGPGIESPWGREFPHPSRPTQGPNQPPMQLVPGQSRG